MPRTFGSLSAYEPGLMDKARWWLQDKLTPVMGGDARRAGDFVQNKVMPTAEYLPGVGDAMAAGEAVDYFKQGQPIFGTLAAAGAAAGLVPGVGDAVQKGIKAAVKSRGDEVLGLLKAGRASEVTDDMLDMGNAADNANLNAYLFDNYDLPMDEASRMARSTKMEMHDLGYHGTRKNFAKFEPSDRTGYLGSYVADNPEMSEDFIKDKMRGMNGWYEGGGNIMQVYGKRGKNADITDRGAFVNGLENEFADQLGLTPSDFIKSGFVGDGSEAMFELLEDPKIAEKLVENFDSIDFMDLHGGGEMWNRVYTKPENLRSRFARFDPRLKHLRNLSAGLAPFGALSLLNAYQDDNYQPPQL